MSGAINHNNRPVAACGQAVRNTSAARHAVIAGLLVLALSTALQAGGEQEHIRRLRQAGLILPLEEVLQRAGHDLSRIIEVELVQRQGIYLYDITLLSAQGEVRKITLDAMSAGYD